MAREFRYEYAQTQPKFVVFNIVTAWTIFRAIFSLKKIEKVCVTWPNKGWTKITTVKDWKRVKG